jgi:hypothetical protein
LPLRNVFGKSRETILSSETSRSMLRELQPVSKATSGFETQDVMRNAYLLRATFQKRSIFISANLYCCLIIKTCNLT